MTSKEEMGLEELRAAFPDASEIKNLPEASEDDDSVQVRIKFADVPTDDLKGRKLLSGLPKLKPDSVIDTLYQPWSPLHPQARSPQCVVCSQKANLKCSKCAGSPTIDCSGSLETWYCSQACQKLHWTKLGHKKMCNRLHCRKRLVRAAELLQLVWETLRCGLYDEEIINLHVDPDERNVFILLNNLVFERAPLYRAFPEDFTTKLPKEVRDILLFARRGRESLFWTGHLFKQLLKGQYDEVIGLEFEVAQWKQRIHLHYHPSMLPITAHKTSIMQVKLKNGEQWVVDLIGRAFGWNEPAMESDTYIEQRAKRMPERLMAVEASKIDLDIERPYASVSVINPTKMTFPALMILGEQHVNLEYWNQWLHRHALDTLGAGFDPLIAGTHAEYLVQRSKFINAIRTDFLPAVRKNHARGDMHNVRERVAEHVAVSDGVDIKDKKALMVWYIDRLVEFRDWQNDDAIREYSCDLESILPEYKLAL